MRVASFLAGLNIALGIAALPFNWVNVFNLTIGLLILIVVVYDWHWRKEYI